MRSMYLSEDDQRKLMKQDFGVLVKALRDILIQVDCILPGQREEFYMQQVREVRYYARKALKDVEDE